MVSNTAAQPSLPDKWANNKGSWKKSWQLFLLFSLALLPSGRLARIMRTTVSLTLRSRVIDGRESSFFAANSSLPPSLRK